MDSDNTFRAYQPLLFSIAYNMLGSVMDAEDCVQETFLRWHRAHNDNEAIQSPKSYLCAIITNLCIDQLRSTRAQRESYDGIWLPEPVSTLEPGEHVEMSELLSIAFLRLLETLSPVERAVFLLRQVFDYDYDEIARIVGKNAHACRQIVYRARQRLASQRPRFSVSAEQSAPLFERFIQATADGDMEALLQLLTKDVALYSDGGELRWPMPIYGAQEAARYLIEVARRVSQQTEWRWQLVAINGRPGVVIYAYDRLDAVFAFEVVDGQIQEVDLIVAPGKLRHLQATI
ncbi:DNA-directed RNA polymerase sigma-70 factor [Reticulibacter mediterranei]|uniref:DNA-directed RNA polymerase sigma-70 factor n=1 Tax=Reticulibacter mediterranei TaxID=2778369 RepID=A0A8J3IU53_9CHLR|nr:RNA polymerase sigma-70 factor [Reticulibacter mediterranei]GHO95346.1 DNA-directed RNA polymerase sigma-70 factor [Reticulibacter mediterranei]